MSSSSISSAPIAGLSAAEIGSARLALAAGDAALARAHSATPLFTWRSKPSGFIGLAGLIVEQQVSVASAAAIWKRVVEGLGTVTPQKVLAHDVDTLKVFGLSIQKARYLRAIAEAQAGIEGNLERIRELDDEAAIQSLTAIKGVGRWTAEAYLMGCEGRIDLFPAGDLALQEGLRFAERAAERLSIKALYARAERWRPYRGVAAHLLWGYYGGIKRGEIASS